MNGTAAICAAFLKGDVLSIKTAFDRFGVSNLPREVGRSIERKFDVHISKIHMKGNSRFGIPCTWFEYRLNKTIPENETGIQKMIEYVKENGGFVSVKPEKKIKKEQPVLNHQPLL